MSDVPQEQESEQNPLPVNWARSTPLLTPLVLRFSPKSDGCVKSIMLEDANAGIN
jgi:hypothetical protein